MDRSLSLLLPVHNAQATLAERVGQLLDILPELTPDFELLIVDDGSTDQTGDIAWELAREFPQVRLAAHAFRRGTPQAIQTGIDRANGNVVFVFEQQTDVNANEIRRMWEARQQPAPAMSAPSRGRPRLAGLIYQLKKWGAAVAAAHETPSRLADNATEEIAAKSSSQSQRGGRRNALLSATSD